MRFLPPHATIRLTSELTRSKQMSTTTTTMKTYYYLRGLAVAALVALATLGIDRAEAAYPGANGKIVFASDRITDTNPTGDYEIFSMNPDGTGKTQLTENTVLDYSPSFSD